jgi:hypothetical protein
MNERMAELVGKAWEEADKEVSEKDWHTWVHDEIFQAKLVELAVKECADMVASSSLPDAYSEPYLSVIAEEMKEHFGVKE